MTARGYERQDVPAKGVAFALAGLFGLLLVAGVLVALMLGWIAAGRPASPARVVMQPPPPRLQVDAPAERHRIEAAARARLTGDADHPSIEQAMASVAREGWR